MNFARPLIPSAIVTCWVSSRTRPMPRRHSMLGTRNTRRPGILCHWSTVTMIKVYQSLNKILVTSEKLIAKWWNMGCKLGKFFESCGFTFDFLVEDGQDHLVTWTWISPFPKQLQFLRTPTPENLLSQKESNLPTIIFRGHVKHQACNIYIYRDSLLHWCQAGADVKEDLKNWAKQQEAELAEDGDSCFSRWLN